MDVDPGSAGRAVAGSEVTVIRISERGQHAGGFLATVSLGDAGEFDLDIADPSGEAGGGNWAWYFGERLQGPSGQTGREAAAEREITAYGEALFSQVFGSAAARDFGRLGDAALRGCRLEVSGSAAFHRLRWEAMREPGTGLPLALRIPFIRQMGAPGQELNLPRRPALNILVVTSRPGGPHADRSPALSRPLLESLEAADSAVTVELVRPGTWDALQAHLRAATEDHGPGWYHAVHLDMPGGLSDEAPLAEGRSPEWEIFTSRPAAGSAGTRGLLYFETAEGAFEQVAAEAVASLLRTHGVPIAVAGTCLPRAGADTGAALARSLADAGVPVAVGMAGAVTVQTAETAMPVFYGELAAGRDPAAAMHAARRELAARPIRPALFGQGTNVQDWMLPVLFSHDQQLRFQLESTPGGSRAPGHAVPAARDAPSSGYGFVGRDFDIHELERMLLTSGHGSQLLVHGPAGTGKSALLDRAAWWWQRTGLIDQVFRFSYEDKAWTCSEIIHEIQAGLPPEAPQAQDQAAPAPAGTGQVTGQVTGQLRERRHLLILDNAESITGSPAAIPHSLGPAEQGKLAAFLAGLRGGRTLVLIGSRGSGPWLNAGIPGLVSSYVLGGLGPMAGSILAARILHRHGCASYLKHQAERAALEDLLSLLDHNPLALGVVLPALATAPPSSVLATLQEGSHGADPGGLISRVVEYSCGTIDPVLQNSLILLAPFKEVACTGALLGNYQNLLLESEVVQALGRIDLNAAQARAVAVNLADQHPQHAHLTRIEPVLTWFLRQRLGNRPGLRAAAGQAHYQLYCQFGEALRSMLFSREQRNHEAGLATARAEYANLTTALWHGLRTSQPIINLIAAIEPFLDQTGQHDTRRDLLDEAIAAYPDPASQEQQSELAAVHNRAGDTAITQRRLGDARTHYDAALSLSQAAGDRRGEAIAHNELGRVAAMQERLDDADASYREALTIFRDLGDPSAGSVCLNLGLNAEKRKLRTDAEVWYGQAADILSEHGNQRAAAGAYQRLGRVSQELQHLDEAESGFRHALGLYQELGQQPDAADVHASLGNLALQDPSRYAEAERSYRDALALYLDLGDTIKVAHIHHNLGALAHIQKKYEEAEAGYRQAFDIYTASGEHTAQASAESLGHVLAELGRHDEAIRFLIHSAAAWRRETGQWRPEHLRFLRQEQAIIGPDEFLGLANAYLPQDVAEQLIRAVDTATPSGQPGDRPRAGEGAHPQPADVERAQEALQRAYAAGNIPDIPGIHQWLGRAMVVSGGDRRSAMAHYLAAGTIRAAAGLDGMEETVRLSVTLLGMTAADDVMPAGLAELAGRVGGPHEAALREVLMRLAGDQQSAEGLLQQVISLVSARAAAPSQYSRWLASWDPVISGIMAEARGQAAASQLLDQALGRYLGNPDWAALARMFQRIRNGARELDITGLDATDTAILHRAAAVTTGQESLPEALWPAMNYAEWLGDIVAAGRGDASFEQDARQHVAALASHGLTQLSNSLRLVLDGERNLQAVLGTGDRDPIAEAMVTCVLHHISSRDEHTAQP